MKKLLSIVISLILCIGMIGCSNSNTGNEDSEEEDKTQIEQTDTNKKDNEKDKENNTQEDTSSDTSKNASTDKSNISSNNKTNNTTDSNKATTLNCPNCGKKISVSNNIEINCPYCGYYHNSSTGETEIYDDNYDSNNSNSDNNFNENEGSAMDSEDGIINQYQDENGNTVIEYEDGSTVIKYND